MQDGEPGDDGLALEGANCDDFYLDGPYVVFTATHHLKRGHCCGNGCRHCPYDEAGVPVPGKGE